MNKRKRNKFGKFINENKLKKLKCVVCGKTFKVFDCRIKAGTKYCSIKCRNIGYIGHGLSRTKFYKTWDAMRYRCSSDTPVSKYYKDKGIKVCEEWKKFENFKEDMYECYIKHSKKYGEKNTTIDRIDNNKNYNKINCRWATKEVQGANRGCVKKIKINNKEKTLKELSKEYNISKNKLYERIFRRGWDVKRATCTDKQWADNEKHEMAKMDAQDQRKEMLID